MYQKFIPHYADICEPLYKLNQKRSQFIWMSEAQYAYERLQKALTTTSVLTLPNCEHHFKLYTDASSTDIVAMFSRKCMAIGYASLILSSAEKN